MPRTIDIFAGDPDALRLASYFEELYDHLSEHGVPHECLPSPWHVLRRVTQAVDPLLLNEWLDAYVSLEGQESPAGDDGDDSDDAPSTPRRTRRPQYLRALDAEPRS